MATTYEQGMRGNGRGAEHDREDMMRDQETMGWRSRGRDMREDLDRRTNRDEIDRRHDWHRGGSEGRWSAGSSEGSRWSGDQGRWGGESERMGGSEGHGRMAGGRMSTEAMRDDLDRRTNRDEIDRRHDWHRGGGQGGFRRSMEDEGGGTMRDRFLRGESGDVPSGPRLAEYSPTRSYGGGAPSAYGSAQYGSEYWGGSGSGGFGRGGYGQYGSAGGGYGGTDTGFSAGQYPSGARGGFSGYAGDEYSGSYGGMGPGPDGMGRAAGSFGGVSGAGSLAGTFGEAAGWESERMSFRPSGHEAHREMRGREGRRGWQREGALVRDVMTRDPRTVSPDTPVREAARLMREEDAGVLPVVHEGRVMGIVTDRDLTTRILAEGRDPNTRVSDVMSSDVHVCSADEKLVDAVRLMGEENVRRLPVVDRDDRLKGMISMTDVAREAEMDYALQEALEQIASRRSFWSRL